MSVLDFYNELLPSFSTHINEESQLVYGDLPITISKKKLVLPIRQYLKAGEWDDKVAFHPLSESNSGKVAPVLKRLVEIAECTLTDYYNNLMYMLISLAADKELSKILPPSATKGLVGFPELPESSAKWLISQLEKAEAENLQFIRFKFVTDVTLKNDKGEETMYSRGVRVKSPLYDRVREDDTRFITAKYPNKGTKEALLKFFSMLMGKDRETFIPDYVETNYSSGTSSYTAPLFTCFLRSYAMILEDINAIKSRYIKLLKELELGLAKANVSTSWISYLDDLKTLVNEIPPQEGNFSKREHEGATVKQDPIPEVNGYTRKKIKATDSYTQPMVHSTAPQQQPAQSVYQTTPAQRAEPEELTLDEMNARAAQRHQPQNMYGQPAYGMPQQLGYGMPQQSVYGMPQQPTYGTPQYGVNQNPILQGLNQQQMMQNPQMYQQMPQQPQPNLIDVGLNSGMRTDVSTMPRPGIYPPFYG